MFIVLAVYLVVGASMGVRECLTLPSVPLSCRTSIVCLMALLGVPLMLGSLFAEKH